MLAGASVATIQRIILDASNMQLSLRDGLSTPNLWSHDLPALAPKLDGIARFLTDELRAARHPGDHGDGDEGADAAPCETTDDVIVRTTAIFDGRAFEEVHAGKSWRCDPEVPNALPIDIHFTGERESADDYLTALVQQLGEEASSSAPEIITTGAARTELEQAMGTPKPVYAATLLKSAMGKGKRSKREAFLNTCGLKKMGDTVHLPAFDDVQQERTLNLIRGLHSLERGIVRLDRLERPTALVVTDDRGLRRRCFTLANPPVVFVRTRMAAERDPLKKRARHASSCVLADHPHIADRAIPPFLACVIFQGRAQFANWIERLHDSPGKLPKPPSSDDSA